LEINTCYKLAAEERRGEEEAEGLFFCGVATEAVAGFAHGLTVRAAILFGGNSFAALVAVENHVLGLGF
jgi:hypothetical protein